MGHEDVNEVCFNCIKEVKCVLCLNQVSRSLETLPVWWRSFSVNLAVYLWIFSKIFYILLFCVQGCYFLIIHTNFR